MKIYCFDIDGVIMTLVPNNDYSKAYPIKSTVELINTLYDKGNKIILFTARGSMTQINWEDLTKKQLENAGIKYHELRFGKPAADYYIDDRMKDLEQLKKEVFSNNNINKNDYE